MEIDVSGLVNRMALQKLATSIAAASAVDNRITERPREHCAHL